MASKLAGGMTVSPASLLNAVGGWRAADILGGMDAVIAAGAQVIYGQIGTNDADTVLSVYQANMIAIKAKADAAGIPIVLGTIPPRGDVAGTYTTKNLWLKFWCAQNKIPLVDIAATLMDPATGMMAAAYNTDNVHPNDAGHLAMAQAIVPVLQTVICTPMWPVISKDQGGLIADPLMAGQYGGFSILAGYYAEISFSHVAAADGDLPAGQWERLTHVNSTGSVRNTTFGLNVPTGWAVGDKLAFFMYVRGSAGALNKIVLCNNSGVSFSVPIEGVSDPGPIAFAYTVGAGVTQLNIGVAMHAEANATSTLDVGALDVFNCTQRGISLPF
jgi:hypothetical protein